MIGIDNRTTGMDNKKKPNNQLYLRPKLDVYNEKNITESNSRQIKTKTKQFNLYFI